MKNMFNPFRKPDRSSAEIEARNIFGLESEAVNNEYRFLYESKISKSAPDQVVQALTKDEEIYYRDSSIRKSLKSSYQGIENDILSTLPSKEGSAYEGNLIKACIRRDILKILFSYGVVFSSYLRMAYHRAGVSISSDEFEKHFSTVVNELVSVTGMVGESGAEFNYFEDDTLEQNNNLYSISEKEYKEVLERTYQDSSGSWENIDGAFRLNVGSSSLSNPMSQINLNLRRLEESLQEMYLASSQGKLTEHDVRTVFLLRVQRDILFLLRDHKEVMMVTLIKAYIAQGFDRELATQAVMVAWGEVEERLKPVSPNSKAEPEGEHDNQVDPLPTAISSGDTEVAETETLDNERRFAEAIERYDSEVFTIMDKRIREGSVRVKIGFESMPIQLAARVAGKTQAIFDSLKEALEEAERDLQEEFTTRGSLITCSANLRYRRNMLTMLLNERKYGFINEVTLKHSYKLLDRGAFNEGAFNMEFKAIRDLFTRTGEYNIGIDDKFETII